MTASFDWRWVPAAALDTIQLQEILALRSAVFVVEQQCPYQDVDGKDLLPATRHLMACAGGRMRGYLRLLDDSERARTIIGRVCVDPAWRGAGLGHALLREALAEALRVWPGRAVYLSAQSHLQAFYASHGFAAATAEYLEDGIPHVGMLRA